MVVVSAPTPPEAPRGPLLGQEEETQLVLHGLLRPEAARLNGAVVNVVEHTGRVWVTDSFASTLDVVGLEDGNALDDVEILEEPIEGDERGQEVAIVTPGGELRRVNLRWAFGASTGPRAGATSLVSPPLPGQRFGFEDLLAKSADELRAYLHFFTFTPPPAADMQKSVPDLVRKLHQLPLCDEQSNCYYALGCYLQSGNDTRSSHGVELWPPRVDHAEAFYWLGVAASRGFGLAQCAIAQYYLSPRGGTEQVDPHIAMMMLWRAARGIGTFRVDQSAAQGSQFIQTTQRDHFDMESQEIRLRTALETVGIELSRRDMNRTLTCMCFGPKYLEIAAGNCPTIRRAVEPVAWDDPDAAPAAMFALALVKLGSRLHVATPCNFEVPTDVSKGFWATCTINEVVDQPRDVEGAYRLLKGAAEKSCEPAEELLTELPSTEDLAAFDMWDVLPHDLQAKAHVVVNIDKRASHAVKVRTHEWIGERVREKLGDGEASTRWT